MYHRTRNQKYAPSLFGLVTQHGPLGLRAPCFEEPTAAEAAAAAAAAAAEKKFSQDDVNAINARTKREIEAKFEGFDALKEKADKVDTLTADIQKMKDDLELRDTNDAEREKILADRAREQSETQVKGLEKQVLDLTALAEKAGATLLSERMHVSVGGSLTKSGVLAKAAPHAQAAFLAETEIKLDDKGKIDSVSIDGVPQKNLDAATALFLTNNPHFKAAAAGGGGATTPNSGSVTVEQMAEMSSEELATRGWQQKSPGLKQADPFEPKE